MTKRRHAAPPVTLWIRDRTPAAVLDRARRWGAGGVDRDDRSWLWHHHDGPRCRWSSHRGGGCVLPPGHRRDHLVGEVMAYVGLTWRQHRQTGEPPAPRGLARIPAGTCPQCAGPTTTETIGQLPLLRHGGHGAIEATTVRACGCGWRLVLATSEVNPRW